ncbi:GGDEF domain-containing protein [Catenovulum sediminis]|uniref:diguanylate cyclase n=1 Tax=Catenovulum sediminis TaxID=1740262 RepID=A0ABV1REI4_9ALTE|nr:GGDEF domain-containing protein [Catenovulum sediminis]
MSEEQIELLKKKLVVSLKARQQLERTYEQQFTMLTNFINRLSNVCKGIDIELDNRLAKLRAHLNKNTDIENIAPLMGDIEHLLNQHSTRLSLNIKQTQNSLITAGKQLQKVKNLPSDLRRELRKLMQDISEPKGSILLYLPTLNRLVSLYQRSLLLSNGGQDLSSEEQANLSALQSQVTSELINILSNIAFSGENADKIDAIREVLSTHVTADTIVNCCVEVIRLIIESITEERQSAQSFLFSLNDALNSVHTAVATSINGSQEINKSKQQLNEKLKNDLAGMSAELSKATSLDTLKKQINVRITDIVDALNQKEQLEVEEHTLLVDSLSEMESRLKELEKEAEEYKKKLSEQRFKSLQDALTKLPNRASLDERMELEYRRWMRYNHDLCVAVADIDHFKNINDTFGHSVGDRVLQIVAANLNKGLRETDYIARYGGEEFVMLFPESKLKDIEKRLDKLRIAISKIPFKFKNADLTVTISMGMTQFKAIDQPQSAFDRADQALYAAKSNGRNKVMVKY